MQDVNNSEVKDLPREECWNCGKELTHGKLFVQVVIKKVVDHEDYWSFDEAGMNPYGQFCIQCLLSLDNSTMSGFGGINMDNLDACIPDWRLQI